MFDALAETLGTIDHICWQFADVIHVNEPQIYAAIVFVLLFGSLIPPSKNDSDQI